MEGHSRQKEQCKALASGCTGLGLCGCLSLALSLNQLNIQLNMKPLLPPSPANRLIWSLDTPLPDEPGTFQVELILSPPLQHLGKTLIVQGWTLACIRNEDDNLQTQWIQVDGVLFKRVIIRGLEGILAPPVIFTEDELHHPAKTIKNLRGALS